MTRAFRAADRTASWTMQLLESKPLRGQNVHHERTVFVQRVDLGSLAGLVSVELGRDFPAALIRRFGNLSGEFLAQLSHGAEVPLARVLLEAIMGLERGLACAMGRLDPVTFWATREGERPEIVDLIWECHSVRLSRAAASVAVAGVLDALRDPVAPVSAEFVRSMTRLRRIAARRRWPTGTASVIQRATERNISCEPLANAYLRLGEGAMQQMVSAAAVASGATDLDRLFPPDAPTVLPTALVVGDRGGRTLAAHLERMLRLSGITAALATRRDASVGGRPIERTSRGRPGGVQFMLRDPRVETLVHAVSPGKIRHRGLRLRCCRTSAIVDLADGAIHDEGVTVAVRATQGLVVVATDHPMAPAIAGARHPSRLMLVAALPRDLVVRRHLDRGGWGTLIHRTPEGDEIRIQRGDEIVASLAVAKCGNSDNPGGTWLRTTMHAMSLAYALGLSGAELATAVTKLRHVSNRGGGTK